MPEPIAPARWRSILVGGGAMVVYALVLLVAAFEGVGDWTWGELFLWTAGLGVALVVLSHAHPSLRVLRPMAVGVVAGYVAALASVIALIVSIGDV